MKAYQRGRPGTCYPYHRLASLLHPELVYVEGVVWLAWDAWSGADAIGAVAVDHAWCETASGQIVDLTSQPLAEGISRHYCALRRPDLHGFADLRNGGPIGAE